MTGLSFNQQARFYEGLFQKPDGSYLGKYHGTPMFTLPGGVVWFEPMPLWFWAVA